MKYEESPQRTRSQPGIEQRFLEGQRALLAVLSIHALESIKIYENQ